MAKQRDDIQQQIRKYLNGKLDTPAMHRLEREALNDPFLADAIEGYDKSAAKQDGNLTAIHRQLQERVKEKSKRIVMWRAISIAASVLILLTIGGIWIRDYQPRQSRKFIAQADKTKTVMPPVKPMPGKPVVQDEHKIAADNIYPPASSTTETVASAPVTVDTNTANKIAAGSPDAASVAVQATPPSPAIVTKDTTPLNEQVVVGYFAYDASEKAGTAPSDALAKKNKGNNAETSLAGKVAGVQITSLGDNISGVVIDETGSAPLPGVQVKIKGTDTYLQTDVAGRFTLAAPKGSILQFNIPGYSSQEVSIKKKEPLLITLQPQENQLGDVAVTSALGVKKENKQLGYSTSTVSADGLKRTVSGIVTDKNDGTALPGVTVKIKGTQTGTQTDSRGVYTIAISPGDVLQFQSIGYQTVNMLASDNKTLTVALQPNTNSLAEVVVTKRGDGNMENDYQATGPVGGWSNFRQYLKENAHSPDHKEGVVKLSFMVNADNSLSDFKIIKSVSTATDAAAIDLVNKGVDWQLNSTGRPQKIKLRIKFEQKK